MPTSERITVSDSHAFHLMATALMGTGPHLVKDHGLTEAEVREAHEAGRRAVVGLHFDAHEVPRDAKAPGWVPRA